MKQEAGLVEQLHMEVVISEKEYVEMQMPITANVLQPFGFLHGGATIALLESAASLGAANNTDFEKELPFGVDVRVRHRKSGKLGGTLRGVANLDRVEGTKWFWCVVAYDDDGDIISEGEILTKIVSLEYLKQKEAQRTQ